MTGARPCPAYPPKALNIHNIACHWTISAKLCYNKVMKTKKKIKIRIKNARRAALSILSIVLVIALIIALPGIFGGNSRFKMSKYPSLTMAVTDAGIKEDQVRGVSFESSNLTGNKAMVGSAVYFDLALDVKGQKEPQTLDVVVIKDAGGLTKVSDSCVIASAAGTYTLKLSACDYSAEYTLEVTAPTPDGLKAKTLLINRYSTVGEKYTAGQLKTREDVLYAYGSESDVSMLESETADAVYEMFEAAKADGYTFYVLSGYRDWNEQKALYDEAEAEEKGQKSTAAPGTSEHQSGLCADLSWSESYFYLYQGMKDTEEYAWLTANAWKYGFVLRYPEGCEAVTGYEFEPWHYRYIGKEDAKAYHEGGYRTLEEYLAQPRNQ